MRYVAAYLLATLGGNKDPSASDIKAILESVGIDVDSERLDVVIKELSGKDISEVIAEGKTKLASVPTGGAAMAGAAAGGGGASAAAAETKEEEKKEEKKEEEEEESDDDMGFGLFD